MIENPATSLLWKEAALLALTLALGLFFVLVDMCEYGLDAKKSQAADKPSSTATTCSPMLKDT